MEKNRYLWWKLADEPVRIPPLDEIKEKVVHAWKMIEARKLAQTKADEYASEVRQAQKPLKEVLKDQSADIFTAGPFSWLSRRTSDPNAIPVLTEVSGVKDAGNDFMKAVFALQPGQAGVAANQPLTVYLRGAGRKLKSRSRRNCARSSSPRWKRRRPPTCMP